VVLVDPAAGLVDPGLIDALVAHAAGHPKYEFFFTQAAPGLAPVVMRPTLLERLAKSVTHAGRLLSYWPDLPGRDPMTTEMCLAVPPAIARTLGRFTLDSQRQVRRLTGAMASLNGELIGSEHPTDGATGATQIYVARGSDGKLPQALGVIAVSDEIKPDSIAAIREFHAMGLRVVLLTGDQASPAHAIANQVGIDDVRAGVKPEGKAAAIREFQRDGRHRVAMVGDGVNDAPALAQADLGIAIGSGSDIAKETGDIVLVSGSLTGVAEAVRLSRATMRTIRQNLFLAFIYNVLAIPLAAFGLLNPLISAGAMAMSDVTVVGNALRLRWMKRTSK